MDKFSLVIVSKTVERVCIALGGILCLYLGYGLYIHGIKQFESGELKIDSTIITLFASGYGPGVIFMIMGAMILIVLAFKSHTTLKKSEDKKGNTKTTFVGYAKG
ncbi:MAG TPA: hypothetical protein DDW84_08820 [Phycisphaerales bacterium]|nr:MAG: hypothetical protein A2Y13_09605 [Planctomycetes bacterium GWC2_45_44]HBG78921.1 hypothetical protein [Phycisphaerales bacterium]HBR18868.1 hypothetical protein [Phycisphaerales bacterium]